MKAVVFAYHEIGCVGIEALLRHGFEVQLVVTHRDDPAENVWFRSVAALAAERGIPVHAPDDPNHPLWVERIRRAAPDFVFSFYYRKLLEPALLDIPSRGAFNLHGSLLPRYRGRCPVNWVLIHGERETGVTLHHMTPRPDAGDIVGAARGRRSRTTTPRAPCHCASSRERPPSCSTTCCRTLEAGTAPRVPQDSSQRDLLRRPATRGRRDRLERLGRARAQPGARRDQPLSGRVQHDRRPQSPALGGQPWSPSRARPRRPGRCSRSIR